MSLWGQRKIKLHQLLANNVEYKLEEAIKESQSIKDSRDSDTKSSAGDKHETARAMIQIELDKNEEQVSRLSHLKNDLSRLNLKKDFNIVEPGSLVITDQGNYFISVGIGKIELDGESYFAISLASPIGKELSGKSPGDKIKFLDKEITIVEIA